MVWLLSRSLTSKLRFSLDDDDDHHHDDDDDDDDDDDGGDYYDEGNHVPPFRQKSGIAHPIKVMIEIISGWWMQWLNVMLMNEYEKCDDPWSELVFNLELKRGDKGDPSNRPPEKW